MRNESGTIAAISTAMSNSGIGIVRMSGEEAVEIAERIYKGKNEKKLSHIAYCGVGCYYGRLDERMRLRYNIFGQHDP